LPSFHSTLHPGSWVSPPIHAHRAHWALAFFGQDKAGKDRHTAESRSGLCLSLGLVQGPTVPPSLQSSTGLLHTAPLASWAPCSSSTTQGGAQPECPPRVSLQGTGHNQEMSPLKGEVDHCLALNTWTPPLSPVECPFSGKPQTFQDWTSPESSQILRI
jgi:hypothetical protein